MQDLLVPTSLRQPQLPLLPNSKQMQKLRLKKPLQQLPHSAAARAYPLEPLDEKFRAFGYAVCTVDGNDTQALMDVFGRVPFVAGKPNLVLARTVKGKGISFMENVVRWHHRVPSDEEFASARRELDDARLRLNGR
jgi:deoxyxylulose-5-phosphate synthase